MGISISISNEEVTGSLILLSLSIYDVVLRQWHNKHYQLYSRVYSGIFCSHAAFFHLNGAHNIAVG